MLCCFILLVSMCPDDLKDIFKKIYNILHLHSVCTCAYVHVCAHSCAAARNQGLMHTKQALYH